jgi:hypothetical protein
MARRGEDPLAVRDLGDAPQVHDRHPVADVLHHAHVVGDEDVRQAQLALEVLQEVQDLCLDRDVEGRHRLVADHEVGLEDEGAGDPDPLPLAAAELVGVAARVVRLEADHVHDPLDPGRALLGRPDAVDAQPLADAVADWRARVEARVRVLEDDLHAAPVRLELRAAQPRDVLAVEDDRPRRRLDEAQEEPADGRLAAARLTDEADRLAAADDEVDAVDRLDRPDRPLEEAALDRKVLHEATQLHEGETGGHVGSRAFRGAAADGGDGRGRHRTGFSSGPRSSRPSGS